MPDFLPTAIPGGEGNNIDSISRVAEATLDQITPPEPELYNISFVDYKEDKCSIDGIDGKNAQTALKIIRDIGLYYKNQEQFSREAGSTRMEIKSVTNSNDYTDYYKKLPTEIVDGEEVKEIKYKDEREDKETDLRIFYYTLSNIFYMLAITANKHVNLDHKGHNFDYKRYNRR